MEITAKKFGNALAKLVKEYSEIITEYEMIYRDSILSEKFIQFTIKLNIGKEINKGEN